MFRVCSHLESVAAEDAEFVQFFSGVGLDYALICLHCARDVGGIEPVMRTVDSHRFTEIEHEGFWHTDRQAILGRPEIHVRPTTLSFMHSDVILKDPLPAPIAAVVPIAGSHDGECLALLHNLAVYQIDPTRATIRSRIERALPVHTLTSPWTIHASPDGTLVAVVETRGRHGVVLDLESGKTTMLLDRGGYRFEHTDFPIAFFEFDRRLNLVHGTDWNRLDVSDPRSGRLLTERTPPSRREGQSWPDHYLDFFHGNLTVSPAGDWIVNNGWVWSPTGVVRSWSLQRWLGLNVWESEDGPTHRNLCQRSYYWDGSFCWIDDRTIAIHGYGNDEENIIPAALLFDVESGRRLRWFPGPAGTFWFDESLFASSSDGTTVWDIKTGERLLHDPDFRPTLHHPGLRQFVTVLPDGRWRMSCLGGA